MALDTATKRASAIHPMLPWRGLWPVPDGAIDQGDRQQLAGAYRGISVVEDTTPEVFGDLTTEFAFYLDELKDANPSATDTTTLVANDVTTVRAGAPTEVDDANTMYAEYLS